MHRTIISCLGLSMFAALSIAPPQARPDSARVEVVTSHRGHTPALLSYVPGLQSRPNAPQSVPIRSTNSKSRPGGGGGGTTWTDGALQRSGTYPTLAASPVLAFAGITADGYVPPDTNLSVGPAQIVETTNVQYAIYNKSTGAVVLGPAAMHTIWSNAGLPSTDLCATTDGGDPIVLWDKADQKWLISQLAYNGSLSQDEWCLAISTTSDATGSYDVYTYQFGSNLPDYPKLGVWQESTGTYSGLYFSANIFASGNKFTGAVFCALPLANSGYSLSNLTCIQNSNAASVLPADVDGTAAAPAGTGGLYLDFSGSSTLDLYQYYFQASNPTASTLSNAMPLTVTTFHEACAGGACVPQPGGTKLDSLGDRLMYRLSYRNYASLGYDALVVNQSVQVSSASNQTGVRWYVIENPGTTPTVTQQSTYSPDSKLYRWMGSVAQDKVGDLGLGFSTSSSSTDPGLAFTGRQQTDTPDLMETQATIHIGTGYQAQTDRWGDYSSMSIDPSDDCTFWYTNEYLKSNGAYTNWATYIGSYKFPSCQ